ncbi:hypothetical protein [Haladaptatus litoreus]|nr:hypothetical protein [Haladaptatus litoreus]
MRKVLSLFMVVALVGTLFAGGAAAAPWDDYKKDDKKHDDAVKQSIDQKANSQVWQSQKVNQQNFNKQSGAAVSYADDYSKSGDATVKQSNYQSNTNVQYADSEAENEASQEA